MNLKKIGLSLALSAVALVTPLTSAFAAGGEWDYLGWETTHWNSTTGYYITDPVYSSGGDFKVCGTVNTNAVMYLYEYDSGSNKDEYVGQLNAYAGKESCKIFRSIGKFVDGDNKKAEFYIRTHANISGAEFWD
ncbi:MAG: hypothetical protein LBV11_08020 [Bacillus cereus]|jgi:hypothetical protein|nr:hypothetical protein [Bacillus cereus]